MNERYNYNEEYLDDEPFSIWDVLSKYTYYWRWFLITSLISLFIAFLYMRYASTLYTTTAKVKIIDENKQTDITSSVEKTFWGLSDINLQNEIEVLKSYRLLREVVTDLDLDVAYFYVGTFKTTEIWDAPFKVHKFSSANDYVKTKWFDIEFEESGFVVVDEDGKEFMVPFEGENHSAPGLPFSIEIAENINLEEFEDNDYMVAIVSHEEATTNLIKQLEVEPTDKKSDILTLWLTGESINRSESIINKIIDEFNQDGIEDKQAMSKRTLDFIDERFIYLTGELDSIESGKQDFKQDNTLAYIEEDATTILRRKSDAEGELFNLETQLSLSKLLRSAVLKEAEYGLLPPDIGLDNSSINSLVLRYNELSRERTKLKTGVSENHPMMKSLESQLNTSKENILKTLEVNQRQLSTSLARLRNERAMAGEMFSKIPEKEKMLRAIERQQSIKENLFLLLLEKREEAAINNAITAPVIKVIDYAETVEKPVYPRKVMVYPIALFLGLFGPFLVLFIKFSADNKIRGRADVEKLNPHIPVMAEIPGFQSESEIDITDRMSIVAESYRILATNILRSRKLDTGKVIFVTSSVKGEGKTTTAINLAEAFAGMDKKVMLMGADLRNPALHGHFGFESGDQGISDYISNPEAKDWKDYVSRQKASKMSPYVCLAGLCRTYPPEILSNENFERFLELAKMEFDCIIVDTAPMLLVSDTRIISEYADISLFLLRVGYTEKRLIEFSKELHKNNELKNMGYVINAVGSGGAMEQYNYGYAYGYGSHDKSSSEDNMKVLLEKFKQGSEKVATSIVALTRKLRKRKRE